MAGIVTVSVSRRTLLLVVCLLLSQERQCCFSLGMLFHSLVFVAAHRKHNRVTLNEVIVCALIFPDIMGSGKTNCMSSYINLFRVIVEAGMKNLITLKSEPMRQSVLHRVNWLYAFKPWRSL